MQLIANAVQSSVETFSYFPKFKPIKIFLRGRGYSIPTQLAHPTHSNCCG